MPDHFTAGALRWGTAETDAEREEVYAFRYTHYFNQLSDAPGVDHVQKRVFSPHDEASALLTGRNSDNDLVIVGTGTRASSSLLPKEWREILQLDRLSALGLDSILIFSRLVERSDCQAGATFLAFFKYSAHYFVARQCAYSIHYCPPALVPLYERLGYRLYGHGHTLRSGLFRLPMILAGADTAYTNRVNPAFARAVSTLAPMGDLARLYAVLPELAALPLCAMSEAERLNAVRRILARTLPDRAIVEKVVPDTAMKPLRHASLLELRVDENPAHHDDVPLIWFLIEGEVSLRHPDGSESRATPGTFLNGHALTSFTALTTGKILVFAPGKPDTAPAQACPSPDFWAELS